MQTRKPQVLISRQLARGTRAARLEEAVSLAYRDQRLLQRVLNCDDGLERVRAVRCDRCRNASPPGNNPGRDTVTR
jgi:hypothetical protein